MQEKDALRRFIFNGLAIRGEWLNLTDSWQAAKQHHQYPDAVMQQLGETLAAATLLSSTIKFAGNLILQVQGDGPLKSLVAQSSNKKEIRGWARCDDQVVGNHFAELLGNGRMVLTIEPDKGEPYQGIVPLTGERIATAVETYFEQSEQLQTRLWLFANQHQAAGLLIQELCFTFDTRSRRHICQRLKCLYKLRTTIRVPRVINCIHTNKNIMCL